MTWMVVEACVSVVKFATSEQFTAVPFKPMLTESIDNIEMQIQTSRILIYKS